MKLRQEPQLSYTPALKVSTLWLQDSWAEPCQSVSLETEEGLLLLAWDPGKVQIFQAQRHNSAQALTGQLLPLGSPGLDPECVSSGPCRMVVSGTGHLLPVVCSIDLKETSAEVTLCHSLALESVLSVSC